MKKAKFPKIALTEVKSSAIAAIGHDPKSNTLRVQFTSGHTYDYENVSAEEHAALCGAESCGKHFHQHLRGREFRKLPPPRKAA